MKIVQHLTFSSRNFLQISKSFQWKFTIHRRKGTPLVSSELLDASHGVSLDKTGRGSKFSPNSLLFLDEVLLILDGKAWLFEIGQYRSYNKKYIYIHIIIICIFISYNTSWNYIFATGWKCSDVYEAKIMIYPEITGCENGEKGRLR